MGGSSPSKCAITSGNRNGRRPVRDGVRMDGEWEYQRVRQGAQRYESVRARTVSSLLLTTTVADDPL